MNNLISSTLIIVSLAIFFGYINPTYGAMTGNAELGKRSIAELEEEYTRYSDALLKTREIEEVRKGLLTRYNAIPLEDRERLEKLLPDHIDSVRLIIDVNNIASQYGMTLKNISLTNSATEQTNTSSPALGPQEELTKAVGLRFGIKGTYDNFRAFLHDLEQSLRIVDIKTISFGSVAEEYEYAVTLSTYKLSVP
ncbi:MAG: hypothetical protein EXS51_02100 [Candidatus Taylorbacteria bacterium]|nr:hypothetical protein [Candidatus Taylorbacteria bacterium]